jgi:hypothetical protein
MTKALIYIHGNERVKDIGKAFYEGCKKHGIAASIENAEYEQEPKDADLVFMYGLGQAGWVFRAYEGLANRVVADVGYWRELLPKVKRNKRYSRISINGQQPQNHVNKKPHDLKYYDRLGLSIDPSTERGDAIIVCGNSLNRCKENKLVYGEWEREAVRRLREVTKRPIVIREKPKNPPFDIDALHWKLDPSEAIRKAHAVVCMTGNIAADCIIHGVPCYSSEGLGTAYFESDFTNIDNAKPLMGNDRLQALADIASLNWTPDQMATGEIIEFLKFEGVI